MGFYLSPLVQVNEIDLTTTIPAVSTSIGAIILRDTYKGPEAKSYFISSINDLTNVFGTPTSAARCYKDMLAAAGFLKYGSMLYATRALAASATYAGITLEDGAISTGTSNDYTLAEMKSATADGGGDVDDYGSITGNTSFLKIVALSRGEHGNKIRVAVADRATYIAYSNMAATNNSFPTSGTTSWSVSAAIGSTDTTIADDGKSFLLLVQSVDQQYSDLTETVPPVSGGTSNWITKEVFNVSVDPEAYDDMGQKRFVETMVNAQSQYIRVSLGTGFTNPLAVGSTDWVALSGGISGALTDADITPIEDALDLYANPEEIDVNIFIDADKPLDVKKYMVNICESRKDAIAILDVPMSDVVGVTGQTAALKDYVTDMDNGVGDINSSYACIYGNWIEVYDKWNGKYRWIPASGNVAGLFANNDYVAEPWFAPAGPNRALITGTRRLAWNPNLADRNILYKYNVNPIVSLAGLGKLIYGQKTLLRKESAFNRINVRRLFMVLEKAISTASKYFLFEPNDDISRLLLVNMIDPFLRDVKARRGIYDYMLVCNTTNNTPERIDRGELWCDIFIKPTRAAEFIILNFIATKTGASFSELSNVTG